MYIISVIIDDYIVYIHTYDPEKKFIVETEICKAYGPDRVGSQLKFRGLGNLIPYEEKWKLINHSTCVCVCVQRGGFDPL